MCQVGSARGRTPLRSVQRKAGNMNYSNLLRRCYRRIEYFKLFLVLLCDRLEAYHYLVVARRLVRHHLPPAVEQILPLEMAYPIIGYIWSLGRGRHCNDMERYVLLCFPKTHNCVPSSSRACSSEEVVRNEKLEPSRMFCSKSHPRFASKDPFHVV